MFIKVTRMGDGEMQLIIPCAKIKSICTGYEERGSRVRTEEGRDEICVRESVDEIWRMMKSW